MTFESRFKKAKSKLLSDPEIVEYNRNLFQKFFTWEEEKLKRQNGLPTLDESSYKTLYGYIIKFRNVNNWFKNKPWNRLTERQIRQVYNDLEDGKIRTAAGTPFQDKSGYYTKVFKSKPFKLAGLHEKAKSALEFFTDKRRSEVRFINEAGFTSMMRFLQRPQHLVLFWLAWDIGENITSLLELKVKNFKRQINRDIHEPEYLVYLPKSTLKRTRQMRREPTVYPETVAYLDALFKYGRETTYRDKLGRIRRKPMPYTEDDFLFTFKYRQALQIFASVVLRSGVRCEPNGGKPSWKDLRSGMACHLFSKGWHVEDINMRLGHTPQSKWFGSYVNYLAVNRKKTVKAHHDNSLQDLKIELEESKQREKLAARRQEAVNEKLDELKAQFQALKEGKGFLKVLADMIRKQNTMQKVLEKLSGKQFDIVIKHRNLKQSN